MLLLSILLNLYINYSADIAITWCARVACELFYWLIPTLNFTAQTSLLLRMIYLFLFYLYQSLISFIVVFN